MRSFAAFDSRRYRTVAPREGYDRWAATYEETVEDAMDLALLERLDVDWGGIGAAADLGCGTGRTGSWLAGHGVGEIDGVDLSPGMLEAARARGVYRSLGETEVAATGLAAAAYDLVVACLVDEHLADLGPLYTEAARLLAPAGRFALVGFHPHFIIASGMPTHFDDAESGGPLAIETHVHLLSDHVAAGLGTGLTLTALHERVVDDEFLALKPKWEPYRGHPISFAFVWAAAR
ncbi:MAG TPA: methyltransferase domain-containing protein [Solirubrobacterales bacterium]|nr:methyltransferase domain-containing protein [Solirubrobacterales bacterium]